MTTSLNVRFTKDNQTKQKAISFINPNASSSELLNFAEAYIDLTNNTFESADRIDKTTLNAEKTIRTGKIILGNQQFDAVDGQPLTFTYPTTSGNTLNITFASTSAADYTTGNIFNASHSTAFLAWYSSLNPASSNFKSRFLFAFVVDTSQPAQVTATLHIDENDTYQALNVPITVNIQEA